jgi:hypothetical protein
MWRPPVTSSYWIRDHVNLSISRTYIKHFRHCFLKQTTAHETCKIFMFRFFLQLSGFFFFNQQNVFFFLRWAVAIGGVYTCTTYGHDHLSLMNILTFISIIDQTMTCHWYFHRLYYNWVTNHGDNYDFMMKIKWETLTFLVLKQKHVCCMQMRFVSLPVVYCSVSGTTTSRCPLIDSLGVFRVPHWC